MRAVLSTSKCVATPDIGMLTVLALGAPADAVRGTGRCLSGADKSVGRGVGGVTREYWGRMHADHELVLAGLRNQRGSRL